MNKPYLIIKIASSLDGRIATYRGRSRWITNTESRAYAHVLRAQVEGVGIGSETLMQDDPLLTCRSVGYTGRQPDVILFDGRLRVSSQARVFQQADRRVFIFTRSDADQEKINDLRKHGAEVQCLDSDSTGHISFKAALKVLAAHKCRRILIEGGGRLIASALKSGLVDEVCWFRAPVILGGDGYSAIGACGIVALEQAFILRKIEEKKFADDVFERYRLER